MSYFWFLIRINDRKNVNLLNIRTEFYFEFSHFHSKKKKFSPKINLKILIHFHLCREWCWYQNDCIVLLNMKNDYSIENLSLLPLHSTVFVSLIVRQLGYSITGAKCSHTADLLAVWKLCQMGMDTHYELWHISNVSLYWGPHTVVISPRTTCACTKWSPTHFPRRINWNCRNSRGKFGFINSIKFWVFVRLVVSLQ